MTKGKKLLEIINESIFISGVILFIITIIAHDYYIDDIIFKSTVISALTLLVRRS